MFTYAYIRVSTDKEEIENQRLEILRYANEKKFCHQKVDFSCQKIRFSLRRIKEDQKAIKDIKELKGTVSDRFSVKFDFIKGIEPGKIKSKEQLEKLSERDCVKIQRNKKRTHRLKKQTTKSYEGKRNMRV
ncbi:MAG: hypothetical protein ABGX27_08930 [Desulfurobacteriaceae bacterium]